MIQTQAIQDAPELSVSGTCDECGARYRLRQAPGAAAFIGCGHAFSKLKEETTCV